MAPLAPPNSKTPTHSASARGSETLRPARWPRARDGTSPMRRDGETVRANRALIAHRAIERFTVGSEERLRRGQTFKFSLVPRVRALLRRFDQQDAPARAMARRRDGESDRALLYVEHAHKLNLTGQEVPWGEGRRLRRRRSPSLCGKARAVRARVKDGRISVSIDHRARA